MRSRNWSSSRIERYGGGALPERAKPLAGPPTFGMIDLEDNSASNRPHRDAAPARGRSAGCRHLLVRGAAFVGRIILYETTA
jgi:hypothetical protein